MQYILTEDEYNMLASKDIIKKQKEALKVERSFKSC